MPADRFCQNRALPASYRILAPSPNIYGGVPKVAFARLLVSWRLTQVIVPFPRQEFQSEVRPEVVDPRTADVEALARWLDYAFALPGGFRYGLSGFIGLIPGIGDVLDALFSLYIVGRTVRLEFRE